MKKINTFLIGAQKAGTTSFFDWLVQHPEIYAPISMKDFHFFTNDRFYSKGIPFFEKQYSQAEPNQLLVNGAVNYIYFSETSAKRIKEYNPDAKLILLLRNPVERAYSAYLFFKKNQEEQSEDFEAAIQKEQTTNYQLHEEKGRFNYIDHGFYARQLESFLKEFSRDQIKIILFEELFQNKEEKMEEVYSYLGVSPNFKPIFVKLNETGQPRFKWVNKLLYVNSPLKSTIKKFFLVDRWMSLETKTKIGFILRKRNTTKTGENTSIETLTPELRQQLNKIYIEDVKKLSSIVNKDLVSFWNMTE